jgi:hypothetical protein
MDIAIHPESRLLRIISGLEVGHGHEPNIPTFVTFANRFQLHKVRILFGIRLQDRGQFRITIKTIKPDIRHECLLEWPPAITVLDSGF